MKNLAKNAGLLFVALGALCVTSCDNKDEAVKQTPPAAVVQTADATLSFKNESDDSKIVTQSVDVKRGDLHAWIESIHVRAAAMELSHNVDFDFILKDNLTPGIGGDFVLGGLAIGRNDFAISTTTNTLPSLISTRHDVNAPVFMNIIQKRNPYAIYTGSATANIVYGQNNSLNPVTLRTQHGRHIALFKLSDELADLGIRAKVTPIIDGVTKTALEFDTELLGHVYWSDNNCTAGKTIQYNIRLMKPNGQPLMDDHQTEVGFKTITVTIEASKSINKTYIVSKSNITENSGTQLFTAEEWINAGGEEPVDMN
jgi:hypothetical protein